MKKLLHKLSVMVCMAIGFSSYGQTAPFTESFDVASTPSGWSTYNNCSSTSANGLFKYGGTLGYDASSCSDNTGNSGSYAWVDGSTPYPCEVTLETDSIDISSLTSLYFEFYLYSYNVTYASSGYNSVSVDFYDGATWNNDVYTYSGSSPSPGWQYAGVDLSTYTTSGKVVFRINVDKDAATPFYNDIAFDDISVKNAPACPLTVNLSAVNISATGATLKWSPVGAATSYDVLVDTAGFDPALATAQNTTADSIVITGLSPATNYDFYVVANCGTNGYSDTSSVSGFLTACAAITLPYSQNWDNTPTGSTTNPSMAPCWTYYETPGHAGYGYTYGFSTPNSAPNHFRMYNSSNTTDTIMIISPEFIGLDNSDKQVRVFAATNTASYNSPFMVGTMSDPTDPSTFTAHYTLTATQNYTEFILPLDTSTSYNGTDDYVAIAYVNSNTFDYLYIDDFFVEDIPPCPKPVLLNVSNITSSEATISWTSSGSEFVIEYGPCGFTQGTGQLDTVTTNSVLLTGLSGNTEYEAYILNECSSAGNGVSVWNKTDCFKTLCNPVAAPISEGFESANAGTTTNPSPPDCWTYVETSGAPGYGYTYNNSTYARTGDKAFRFYSSSNPSSNADQALVSPAIQGISTTDKRIEFWARSMYSGTSYNVRAAIGTMSDPSDLSTLTVLDTFHIGNNTTYQYFVSNLTAANGYNGTDQYIAIVDASDATDYLLVDDIDISDVPSCMPSSGLTVDMFTNNSADLSWIPGEGIGYQIEYGPTGFTQGTGPVIKGIIDSSYSLTGLTGNTCYDVYVRDTCANGLSPWFGPITFCTACDPVATPITEGFEGIPTGSSIEPSMPACWSYWESPTTSGYGYTYGFANPNTGSQHFRMYSSTAYPDDSLGIISPAVSGLTNGDKMIRFYAKSSSSTYNNFVIVGTTPTPGDLRNATAIDTIETDGSAYSTQFQVYLDTASGYNGTDEYVFLMHGKSPNYTVVYLDDIEIVDIPACAAPWNLDADNITASSADLEWYNLQGTAFRLEWGPQGFVAGSGGNGTVVQNATSPTTINGLSPNTFYDFYVADNCDTNNLSGPYTFKTPCLGTLSGTYTVGGASADFATLDSAFAVLLGCGVSGPVTFNLQGMTHNVPGAYISSSIAGISATNNVTINGMGVSSDSIVFAQNVAHGIDFDGGGHFSFNNLTLDGTNVTGRTVWMHNGASDVSFDNCHIINGGSTSSVTGGIIASSTETSNFSAGDNASDISVTNCTFKGGYAGVIFYGQGTTARNSGFVVENNIFDGQYYYGIRFYYTEDIVMRNNENITPMNYPSYNYYVDDITIEGNKFSGTTYGLYLGYVNTYAQDTPAVKSIVRNNFITASGTYGAYCYSLGYVDYTHNTIVGTGTYGQYLSGTTTYEGREVTMVNNIFVGGSNYGLYGFPASFDSVYIDHNIYYSTTGSNVAYWNTAYATAAAWNTADGSNANSLDGDPGFVSPTDFHIIGTLVNDEGINGFATVDIDGDTRPASGSTNVDIGADEYTPLNWDASVEGIVVPMAGCGDSTLAVSIAVINLGLNDITSLPVAVDVTGDVTASLSATYSTTIPAGSQDTIFVGTINTYAGANSVDFMGYTGLTTDQKNSNDTLTANGAMYLPFEPQYYPEDTVCANADSATFAAVTTPGAMFGWYANPTDTVPVAQGDSFTFAVSGQTTWYLAYLSNADSLETTFAAGNGQSGNMFDLNALNTVSITGFTVSAQSAGTVEIYYKSGSYVGSQGTASAWTLLTPTAVSVAGTGADYVDLPAPLTIAGGQTHAFYVTMTSGSVNYTNGSTVGSLYASNSDLEFYEGIGIAYPFGGTFSPRIFNGRIHYGSKGCTEDKKALVLGLSPDSAYANYSFNIDPNGADVDFDASTSTGHVYDWDFGDGNTGTGVMPSHTYATADTFNVCLYVTDTACGDTDTICKTVLTTVGIDESLLNQSLNVFPNPSVGNFAVDFQVEGLKDIKIRVVTLLGQEVYASNPGTISGEYRETIDLSDKAQGVYILQIQSDDDVISRKLTIRR